MALIGKYNTLTVLRKVDFGFYLDGQSSGEILLPLRYAPANCRIGDKLEVFIYFDSEDRIIATTQKPFATVGEFAWLQVSAVNQVGAFLDWGLPKDLLVPFREQKQKMETGKYYAVFLYIDTVTERIAASAKLAQFLNHEPINYLPGDVVDLFVTGITDLGYKVIINNRHEGILYKNEVFSPLKKGVKIRGYVRKVRDDGKVDLRLLQDGYDKVSELSGKVLDIIRQNSGFIDVTDKSPAERIYREFGMSKKVFKQVLGALYRNKQISLTSEGISLL